MRILCMLVLVLTTTPLVAQEKTLVAMVEERVLAAWPTVEAVAREFEAENPGVRVKLVDSGGAAGAYDKVKFMLAGDVPLDVIRLDVMEVAAYIEEGALLDLQPYFDADARAGRWMRDDFFGVIDGLTGPDGHLYGLPSTFTPYVMYYNRDILERAGIPVPADGWTWDDLLAGCRRATRDLDGDGTTDQWGISLTQWLQSVVNWIWQNGGTLLKDAGTRANMNDPAVVEALDFLRRLLHEEKVASFDATFENQLSQGLFQAGRTAFYGPVGYWETYRFKHIEDFAWDVAPLPRGRQRATSIAMQGYCVPRTARHPELAYRFVRKLGEHRLQAKMAEIGNGVPGLRAAALSPAFLKPDVPPESEQVFLDVLDDARFLPPVASWRKIEALCRAEIEGVLLLNHDVRAACDRMTVKVDDYLARRRARADRPRLGAGPPVLALAGAFAGLLAAVLVARRRRAPLERPASERQAWWMCSPWIGGVAVFIVGPGVLSLLLAFCEWSPLRPIDDVAWVGADNFVRMTQDATLATSLRVTAIYAFVSVPLGLALALGLALLVRHETLGSQVARTLFYVPAIISPVVIAAVWRWILDPDQGILNGALGAVGIPGPAWIRSPDWVLPSYVLMSLWTVGSQMLVFVAGLQAVDRDLEDAARLDGARPFSRFLHVTLPALTPVLLFNLVLGIVNAFQIFAQPYVMTQGGPGDSSRFLVLYLYETGFRHLDMGYASAIAWLIFAIVATLVGVTMLTSRRWVHYAQGEGA